MKLVFRKKEISNTNSCVPKGKDKTEGKTERRKQKKKQEKKRAKSFAREEEKKKDLFFFFMFFDFLFFQLKIHMKLAFGKKEISNTNSCVSRRNR